MSRINYKQLGSRLSVDEYNGLVYILRQQTWDEVIPLTTKGYKGKYGTYTLHIDPKVIADNRFGYRVLKSSMKACWIDIETEYTGSFHGTFKFDTVFDEKGNLNKEYEYIQTNKELTKEDELKIQNDFLNRDKLRALDSNNNNDIETQFIQYSKDTPDLLVGSRARVVDGKARLYIPIEQGRTPKQIINKKAIIQLIYDEPEINVVDGVAPEQNQIICENFNDLRLAINTTPWGGTVNIKLLGKEYKFTDELYIENKTVHIVGGNQNSLGDNYTVLNAQHLCRHFNIHSRANVTVENCKFINGYAMGNKSRKDLHHRGGSVFLTSGYKPYGGDYLHLRTMFTCNNCQFVDNSADRGGAIYNRNARLELNNCVFDNNNCQYENTHNTADYSKCKREYRKWNWGGAIRSESVPGYYYDEPYDRLHIQSSKVGVDPKISNGSIVNLVFSELQNTRILNDYNIKTKGNGVLRAEYFDYTHKKQIKVGNVEKLKKTSEGLHQYNISVNTPFKLGDRGYFKFTLYDENGNGDYSIITKPIAVLGTYGSDGKITPYFRQWEGESVILATLDSPVTELTGDRIGYSKVTFRLALTNNNYFMDEIKDNIHTIQLYDFTDEVELPVEAVSERMEKSSSNVHNAKLPYYYYEIEIKGQIQVGHRYQFRVLSEFKDKTHTNWYRFNERITRIYDALEDKNGKVYLKIKPGN